MSSTAEHSHGHGEDDHHVVSVSLLTGVFVALLFLTFVTVAVTVFDLGQFNLFVALFIATIKAFLVGTFFMHLKWDSPFNTICLIGATLFLCLFIGLSILDSAEYKRDQDNLMNDANRLIVPKDAPPAPAPVPATTPNAGEAKKDAGK